MGPLALINIALVGFMAFAALHYSYLWWFSRRERVLLVFALFSVQLAVVSAGAVGVITATSISQVQSVLDVRTSAGILMLPTMTWLVSQITGVRARWFVTGILVLFVSVSIVSILGWPLNGTVTEIQQVRMAWGERLTVFQRDSPGWWAVPVYVAAQAVPVFTMFAGISMWRRDRVGGAMVVMVGAAAVAGMVLAGLADIVRLPMPYLANLAYALWVPVLALLLSREYARRGERVASSEQKFKAIFDHTFQFTGLLTVDGTVLEANRTALTFAGIQPGDVVGKPFWDTPWWTHSPAQQERLQSAVREAASGATVRFEVTNAGANRQLAYVDFSIKPVRDDRGNIILLIPEGRDITERKHAEEALVMSEARYRTLIESAPEAIVVLDMEAGCFADANQNACALFGLSMAELRTRSPVDVSPPVQPDGRASSEAAADYLLQALEGERPVFEWTHRTHDGTDTLCEVRLVRLPDADRVLIRGSIADITERKRAEQAMRDIQSRHSAILESSLDGLIVVDGNSRIIEFNSVAETIFGHRREDAVGARLPELLIPTRLRDAHYRGMERYLATGIAAVIGQRLEMPAMRADGSEVHVELSIQPIADVDPPLFAGVVRDITERLRLEEQLRQSQKMEAVGQLAGGVAHDFNNLLTVIAGYCEILLTQLAADEELYHHVRSISDAGERAASLTQRLLAFSRQAVLAPTVLNINSVVSDTERMLRRLIGEDILLTVSLDANTRPVRIDPGHMSQVVMNLALNARDALPKGGTLTIQTSNVDLDGQSGGHPDVPAGRYVQLVVHDDGSGIASEVKARIFEPFFTTKGVGKGTGLGLAVVHGIIRQSGGHITVESEVGQGTTFTIYLPAVDEVPTPPERPESVAEAHGVETVLIVEDEDAVRRLEELALRRQGFNVLTAADGAEALRMARSHDGEIDLLATDVVMPNMSGRDLADTLRSERAGLKVLFLSGYTDDTLLRHGVFDAHEAFLQKPFTLTALARKVREVLDRK